MASTSTNRKLLLDENLSWRIARDLAKAGYDVLTTTQANLAGLGDHLVFQRAQHLQRIIVTRDSDFLTRFAPPHAGIIVLDCDSTVGNRPIVQKLLQMLPNLLTQELADRISVVTIP
jgi:predicted nuclease of predicted toxin-antitoxin system